MSAVLSSIIAENFFVFLITLWGDTWVLVGLDQGFPT